MYLVINNVTIDWCVLCTYGVLVRFAYQPFSITLQKAASLIVLLLILLSWRRRDRPKSSGLRSALRGETAPTSARSAACPLSEGLL